MSKLAYFTIFFLLVIFSHLQATAHARKFPSHADAAAKKHDIHVSTITMLKMLQSPEGEAETETVAEGEGEGESKTKLEGTKSEGDSETETGGTRSEGDTETETGGTKSEGDSETETETKGTSESQSETGEESDQSIETPWNFDDYDDCVGKPCDKYKDINETDNLDPYYCKYEDCDCSTIYGIGDSDDDDEEPHCLEKIYNDDGELENFLITKADDVFHGAMPLTKP